VALAEQGAVTGEERRTDGDATLVESFARLVERHSQHLSTAIEAERESVACRHGRPCDSEVVMSAERTYRAQVGSQTLELPIVDLNDELSIALLISVDHGVGFSETAGTELAAALAGADVEIVVSVATMGIPLAIETTRALGLDDYVILHKTEKIHLAGGESETVRSITTDKEQRLLFDVARLPSVAGRRVAVVDDVISTGGSITAALRLLRRLGAQPVALGCLVTEGTGWRRALGADADMVHSLGAIPVFGRDATGEMVALGVD